MEYVLLILLSSPSLDAYSVATQEFSDKPACIHAVGVIRDEITGTHGAIRTTLRCVPKSAFGLEEEKLTQ